MNRRKTLKTLLVGSIAGAALGTTACKNEGSETVVEQVVNSNSNLYGRTPEEIEIDKKLMAQTFLNEHELETIAVLCDIILPPSDTAGGATDAKVPAFIEFMVKDLPANQLPMRGGLAWLENESHSRFNKSFKALTNEEQIQIVEDIAYEDKATPEMEYGVQFFNLMRNLTLTGYYTSEMGIKDLGYQGNRANVWDGVPEEILKDHDVEYDPEWLAKCVDQEKRNDIAEWDDQGNLLT